MIMVESRFRVANGMEADVRNAFLNRPGLVDNVMGFLGMEVYSAKDDQCVFHLITRWTDHHSYDAWHRSDAHHHSHAFIPRGLKLDSSFTRLTVLERLERAGHSPTAQQAVADAAPTVAAWLAESENIYVMLVSEDCETAILSRSLAERVDVPFASDTHPLATLLANNEASELAERIGRLRATGQRGVTEHFLLNVVNASGSPFTLRCRMDAQRTYAIIVAEGPDIADDHLRDTLLRTNNQLAVLAREREAARHALELALIELADLNGQQAATLEALDSSYWHIQRIHEMLPICMNCGEVKSAQGGWQHARDFLMENAMKPFLTHGYCPACAERMLAAIPPNEIVR